MSNETPNQNQYPLGEPSVLDYVKSLLRFSNGDRIQIPEFVEDKQQAADSVTAGSPEEVQPAADSPSIAPSPSRPFPYRSLLAFILAFIGQGLFEPPPTTYPLGYAFYIGALSLLGWAILRGEWSLPELKDSAETDDPLTYRLVGFIVSVALAIWSFFIFGDHFFTTGRVLIWGLSVAIFLWTFWLTGTNQRGGLRSFVSFFRRDAWTINISRWTLLLIAATALVFFFRFHQTRTVPPEPFSDHAEKILDVYDVSMGLTRTFFPRNTGREAIQMYWTLLVANVFGTGLSFLSLKLGTAILGFLTTPFIYLLGKEIGGRRVGLFAFIMAGIGYWPNVISRVGLRFPLYPLFAAPTLFFLIRGLRTRNRNDFLLSGLFLGLGLHGYSPFRIMPLVVVVAFALYELHVRSKNVRRDSAIWLTLLALTSLFVFVPLLRYWFDDPAMFGFRAFSRLSTVEQPLPGPAFQIFISNLWNALQMFNFDDGEIWVHSVVHRPALDTISAVLFIFGVILVTVRYLRNRHWLDLFLLVSITLLLLPSILSLAYPGENPALNRAGGAYIPAFILGAMALDGLVSAIGFERRRAFASGLVMLVLLSISVNQNYDLVFRQYKDSFRGGAWNSSDMGKVISEFRQTYGTTDTIWIVPFPHWVDTRLPAVWAGIPNRDMAMWRDNLPGTVELPGPKLFLVKASVEDLTVNDQETLDVLGNLYPNGQLRMFDSDVPGHDFWIFFVPK